MTINPEELDQLMNEVGVGSRTAGKLRRALAARTEKGADPAKPTSRGHGAPAPTQMLVPDL